MLHFFSPRSRPWTPAMLRGSSRPVVWLDALDNTTFTMNEPSAISQWADKSGNGNHATQSTAANQPFRCVGHNYLVQSQALATTWLRYGIASATNNADTAPDGTATATKIVASNANDAHVLYQTIGTASVYTNVFSIRMKAAEYTYATLIAGQETDTVSNRYCVSVNLSDGSVTQTGTAGTVVAPSHSVKALGAGWYEVAITMTVNSGNWKYVMAMAAHPTGTPELDVTYLNTRFIGDNSSGALFWGAQVNPGTILAPYQYTAATQVTGPINNRQSVWFDGGDGFMLPVEITTPRDIFAVNKGYGYLFAGGDVQRIAFTPTAFYWNVPPGVTAVAYPSGRTTLTSQIDQFSLVESGPYAYRMNGTVAYSGTSSSGTNGIDRIGLRYNQTSGIVQWTGAISEVIILSGVASTENRQKIEGYLADRWWRQAGLQVPLPNTHPYYYRRPTV